MKPQVVFKFEDNTGVGYARPSVSSVWREGRIAVMAAMESGNFDRARMLITEIEAEFPEFGEALRLDIIDAYGLRL